MMYHITTVCICVYVCNVRTCASVCVVANGHTVASSTAVHGHVSTQMQQLEYNGYIIIRISNTQ